MPREKKTFSIEERPGNEYPSLEAAQQAALPLLSKSLYNVIQELLEQGVLVYVNGVLIPNPQGKSNG